MLIEDFNRFQPTSPCRIVQLAEITQRSLPRAVRLRTVSTSDQ